MSEYKLYSQEAEVSSFDLYEINVVKAPLKTTSSYHVISGSLRHKVKSAARRYRVIVVDSSG
jgi:hypothetical protein